MTRRITFIVFGFWIGFLLAGSTVIEFYLEGQIVSPRTMSVVSIIFLSGTISSALSWWLFYRSSHSFAKSCFILSATGFFLFLLFGVLTSYAFREINDLFEHGVELGELIDLPLTIILGVLGTAFSFKTFGLPLLWPLGAISGIIGTLMFVYVNKRVNFGTRH